MREWDPAWPALVTRCLLREEHLVAAVDTCDYIDQIGVNAVLLCLEHSLGVSLSAQAAPGLGERWAAEDAWGTDLTDIADQNQFAFEVLVDEKGEDVTFAIGSPIPPFEPDPWGIRWMRVGDRGWVVGDSWDRDEARDRGVIGRSWDPVDDAAAHREAVMASYRYFWRKCAFPPGPGPEFVVAGSPLLVDCLEHLFVSDDRDARRLLVVELMRAWEEISNHDRAVLEQLNGGSIAVADLPAPDVELLEAAGPGSSEIIRPLVASYVALMLPPQVLGP